MIDNGSNDMFGRIEAAGERLRGQAAVTPVQTSRTLNRMAGTGILLKCENFQRVGAFKFRGAYNAVSRLSPAEKARGVVTFSSGNHAQAMALVGRLLGVATTVVMPADAPAIKRTATEAYGATVIDYDPLTASREELARGLEAERGFTMIPPFDHEDVIAGQGTAALEMIRLQSPLDALLVPCGGGGLLSGSAVAVKGVNPACRVIGVEPELADDATRSFRTGTLHSVHNPPTIADGTRTPCLGNITFPLIRKYVDDMQTVSEDDIIAAVRFLFYRMKLVVEPSGALGVAALLAGRLSLRGNVGVILSGGNIDGPTMTRILK
ncbi:MAG: threo-3-hydroxy-L-aspartate ammonia-lyase [Desulfobacterales bacterium]